MIDLKGKRQKSQAPICAPQDIPFPIDPSPKERFCKKGSIPQGLPLGLMKGVGQTHLAGYRPTESVNFLRQQQVAQDQISALGL